MVFGIRQPKRWRGREAASCSTLISIEYYFGVWPRYLSASLLAIWFSVGRVPGRGIFCSVVSLPRSEDAADDEATLMSSLSINVSTSTTNPDARSLSLSELSQTLENLSESFHLGSSPINNDMGRTSNVAPWSYVPAKWNEKTSIVKNSQRNFVVGRASWKILTKQEVDECVCLANQHRYSRFIAEDAKISDDRISYRN